MNLVIHEHSDLKYYGVRLPASANFVTWQVRSPMDAVYLLKEHCWRPAFAQSKVCSLLCVPTPVGLTEDHPLVRELDIISRERDLLVSILFHQSSLGWQRFGDVSFSDIEVQVEAIRISCSR